jgi:hypothetical protein
MWISPHEPCIQTFQKHLVVPILPDYLALRPLERDACVEAPTAEVLVRRALPVPRLAESDEPERKSKPRPLCHDSGGSAAIILWHERN